MLEFSNNASMAFAGRVLSDTSDDLMCYGPLDPQAVTNQSDLVFVPGTSETAAESFLQDISGQVSENLSASIFLYSGSLSFVLRYPEQARNNYFSALSAARTAWIEDGSKVTPRVAKQLSQLRTIIRDAARQRDVVPNFAYQIIDKIPARKRKVAATSAKIAKLMNEGKYGEVIESALKTNQKVNKSVAVASKASKFLRAGNVWVAVADISASSATVYLADTEEAQQKALEQLGDDVGTSAGLTVGAKICTVMAVTTAGIGLVGCGIALGAGYYFGGKAGSALIGGQAANEIVSSLKML